MGEQSRKASSVLYIIGFWCVSGRLRDPLILETPSLLPNPGKQEHAFTDYLGSLAALITKPVPAHAACSVVDELEACSLRVRLH